jgi:hypothetical protein
MASKLYHFRKSLTSFLKAIIDLASSSHDIRDETSPRIRQRESSGVVTRRHFVVTWKYLLVADAGKKFHGASIHSQLLQVFAGRFRYVCCRLTQCSIRLLLQYSTVSFNSEACKSHVRQSNTRIPPASIKSVFRLRQPSNTPLGRRFWKAFDSVSEILWQYARESYRDISKGVASAETNVTFNCALT